MHFPRFMRQPGPGVYHHGLLQKNYRKFPFFPFPLSERFKVSESLKRVALFLEEVRTLQETLPNQRSGAGLHKYLFIIPDP
jgi:hypothetical protein